jgi:hypothetical protein
MLQADTRLRRYLPAVAIVATGLLALTACGSTTDSGTDSSSAVPTNATQSATIAPTADPVDGWPADVPAPTGLKSIGASSKSRIYAGPGTVSNVAAQMTSAFTDAGYQIAGEQVVTATGVSVKVTKDSTEILMVVSESGGKGNVNCVLGLTT